MNLLTLGHGDTASGFLRIIIELNPSSLSQIHIVGLYEKEMSRLSHELVREGGPEITWEKMNIQEMSQKDLEEFIGLYDFVGNFIGPYYMFGKRVVEAVTETGTPYVDICDDWKVTQELIEDNSLNKKAKKNKVPVIIGIGISPGQTNIIGKLGASKLDRVKEIHTIWGDTSSSSEPTLGATRHIFEAFHGEAPTFKDGEFKKVRPLIDGEEIIKEFPPPLDNLKVFYCGHPEPVTLPNYFDEVELVNNKVGSKPGDVLDIYRLLDRLGFLSQDSITINGNDIVPREFTLNRLTELSPRENTELFKLREFPPKFGCLVRVKGEKGGGSAEYTYLYTDRDHLKGTVIPPALAVKWILDGKIDKAGILTPEEAVENPKRFITQQSELGVGWRERYKLETTIV